MDSLKNRVITKLLNLRLKIFYLLRKRHRWRADAGSFARKKYGSYSEYVRHQQSKLKIVTSSWLPEYDIEYRKVLSERIRQVGFVKKENTVLCLAARLGTEVKAFLDNGCFAVGVDLNPGPNNKYVVVGDFHDLQFAGDSVDAVFSNSFDHAFDLDKLLSEVRRVLKADGRLILELGRGKDEGNAPGYYESFFWRSIDAIIGEIESRGFRSVKRVPISYPWPGEHVCFVKEN